MDYEEFKSKIGEEMDMPTDEQVETLVEGDNTVHIQVIIGHELITGEDVALPFVVHGDKFVQTLDTLRERGAVRGEDYLLCAFLKHGRMIAVIHTKDVWISDEDVL